MYPDSWIYRGFTSCNFDLCWKQNGGHDNDLRKIHGFRLLIYAQTALVLNSTTRFCNATSNFDKCHDILCLRAEFAKHTKAPSPLTTRWKTWPGFWLMAVARLDRHARLKVMCFYWLLNALRDWFAGLSPDISRSHLYRGTFPWTPPTAIYRAYTVYNLITWYINNVGNQ